MKSRFFISLTSGFLFFGMVMANHSRVDSLKNVLSKFHQSHRERLNMLLELNRELLSSDVQSVKPFLDEAMVLSQNLKDSLAMAEIFRGYGAYFHARGEYGPASDWLVQSIALAEKFDSDSIVENAMNILAVVYTRIKEDKKAEEIFQKLIRLAEKNNQRENLLKYKLNYSTFLAERGHFVEAEKNLLSLVDSAKKDDFYYAVALNSLSFLYNSTQRYAEALEHAQKAVPSSKKIGNVALEAEVMTNIANAYYGLGNYLKSIEINRRVIDFAGANALALQRCNAYGNLYLNYEALNDYKTALEYFKQYSVLKDSIINEDIAKQIHEIHTKYEVEKKEVELRNKERILNIQSKLIKAYFIIAVISIGLGITLVVFYAKQNSAYQSLVRVNLKILQEQRKVETIKETIKEALGKKYHEMDYLIEISTPGVLISDAKKRVLIQGLQEMLAQKIYLRKDLSIEKMASELNTNARYLSQLIHELYQTNFNQFINELRINEARRLLWDPAYDHYSIEGIADMVGFSSKQAFHQVFKKWTGVTPIYYKKQSKPKRKFRKNCS